MTATTGRARGITAAGSHLRPAGTTTYGPADHPNGRAAGELVRFERTGLYALHVLGSIVSVPQRWARAEAGR